MALISVSTGRRDGAVCASAGEHAIQPASRASAVTRKTWGGTVGILARQSPSVQQPPGGRGLTRRGADPFVRGRGFTRRARILFVRGRGFTQRTRILRRETRIVVVGRHGRRSG